VFTEHGVERGTLVGSESEGRAGGIILQELERVIGEGRGRRRFVGRCRDRGDERQRDTEQDRKNAGHAISFEGNLSHRHPLYRDQRSRGATGFASASLDWHTA
jgi:hypothetical protein